jgi:hypothetical protein
VEKMDLCEQCFWYNIFLSDLQRVCSAKLDRLCGSLPKHMEMFNCTLEQLISKWMKRIHGQSEDELIEEEKKDEDNGEA